MRIGTLYLILCTSLSLITLGCTKANPGFDLLDNDAIPQPLFSGKTTTSYAVSSSAVTKTVNGECDVKITGIVAQVVGMASATSTTTLSTVAVTSPLINCSSSGKFQFEMKSLSDLGFSAPVEGKSYEVQLRGMTSAGVSKPSSIYIRYTKPTPEGVPGMVITSGSTESGPGQRQATSSSFKAEIRIDHATLNYTDASVQDAMTKQSSPHFRASIGAAARTAE